MLGNSTLIFKIELAGPEVSPVDLNVIASSHMKQGSYFLTNNNQLSNDVCI